MTESPGFNEASRKIEKARLSDSLNLDLKSLHLTELPSGLAELSQLQTLDLRGNRLTTLSDSLAKLSQLRSLNLSGNQLTLLPDSIAELTQLQFLNLSRNELRSLPDSVAKLAQLVHLNLSGNCLTSLPGTLARLCELESFNLNANQLTSLDESLGQLSRLESLHLIANQLTSLPDSLAKLSKLRILLLGSNRLTSLPDSFAQLSQLHLLDISSNQLTSLPDWLAHLSRLQFLHVRDNQLTILPDSLGLLSQLKGLDLRGNHLTSLAEPLSQLSQLATLDLDGNPFTAELAAARDEGVTAVKRYLRRQAEAQIPLNESKLILVGEGEVGKSCLLGALRGDKWIEGRATTHGIDIQPVQARDEETGKAVSLNAWDFGGQPVYRPTHQLFFSAPAVYLVVWKPREGPQQGLVKEWIKLIKHRAPGAKILVVATHGGPGERQPDLNRQDFWDLFGKDTVIDFFHVDSKPPDLDPETKEWTGEGTGIANLKQAIAKLAISLPEVGRLVPKRWWQTWKAFRSSGEAHLPLSDVLKRCEAQEMQPEEASEFVRISHRLGRLIHYSHDPRLKDTVILKPDWLATAISFVLDDKETRAKHGLVRSSRLGRLWSDPSREPEFRYPEEIHAVFLAIMEQFDLSYRVAGVPPVSNLSRDETSLIAQLVPDTRPPEADLLSEWPAQPLVGESEKVQICRILDERGNSTSAEGLFYQLIVRFHRMSLGREDFSRSFHWQRGLVLEDGYNGRAFLEQTANDLRITVRAAYPTNLLSVLTHDVKWLVEDFWKGLKCQVVVPCVAPCGKNKPGTGVFEVDKLITFYRKGRVEFPCTISGCDSEQSIDCLLQNAVTRTPIETQLKEISAQVEEVREGQDRQMSQIDEMYTGLLHSFIDEAKDGPRLFTVQPFERSRFNPNEWIKKKIRITLWCEYSRLPLPLLNRNEPDKGVYEIEVSHKWFASAAPGIKRLAAVMSLVLPVAAAAYKLSLEESVSKAFDRQFELSKESIKAMIDSTDKTADWLSEKEDLELEPSSTDPIRARAGVLRQFQIWLKEKDPTYGSLVRVQNKRREFLWVHPDFEKEF